MPIVCTEPACDVGPPAPAEALQSGLDVRDVSRYVVELSLDFGCHSIKISELCGGRRGRVEFVRAVGHDSPVRCQCRGVDGEVP